MIYYRLVIKGSCPFCIEAVSLLENREEEFIYTDMEQCSRLLKQVQDDLNYHTVPMIWKIFIDDDGNETVVFIGGCDNLKERLGA